MDLAAIKALFAEHNPFAALLGIEILDIAPGNARTRLRLDAKHRNPFGTANAGAVFSLAETAFGLAANAYGNVAVAVNLSISYIKPGVSGELLAEAREVSRGGPLSSYEVTVTNDQGQVIAHAQAMAFTRKETLERIAGI